MSHDGVERRLSGNQGGNAPTDSEFVTSVPEQIVDTWFSHQAAAEDEDLLLRHCDFSRVVVFVVGGWS